MCHRSLSPLEYTCERPLQNSSPSRPEYISAVSECFGEQQLDYCNSLFLLLTDLELRRLQLVQKSLCRVVTRSSKSSHITPQLKKLHYLPVRYRVQFKIGLITYKILNQGQPVYQRELIQPFTSSRNTRRSTPKLKFLQTPTFDHRVHKSIKHLLIPSVTLNAPAL